MSIPPISDSSRWSRSEKFILDKMPTAEEAEALREFEDMKLKDAISRIDKLSESLDRKEKNQQLKQGFFACYLKNISLINQRELHGIGIQGRRQDSFEEFKEKVMTHEQTEDLRIDLDPEIKKVPKESIITKKSNMKKKTTNLA